MKYVMAWTTRFGGSGKENEESAERALQLFSKWQAPAGSTFHQFVGRLDGDGGFAVVETDDPALIARDTAIFSAFFDFMVYPVLDIQESARIGGEAVEFRRSA